MIEVDRILTGYGSFTPCFNPVFWPRFSLCIPFFPDPWLQQQRYVAKIESVLLHRRSAISRAGQQRNGPAGTTDLDLYTFDLDLPRGALAWQPQGPPAASPATPGGEHAAMPVHQRLDLDLQLDLDAEVSPFCSWEDQQDGLQQLAAPDGGTTSVGQAVPDQGVKAALSAAGAAAPPVPAATPKGAAWGLRRLATVHTAPARGRQASLARLRQQREQRRRCSAAQSGFDSPEARTTTAAKGALPAMTAAAPMTRATQRAVMSATDVVQKAAPFQGFTPGEVSCQVVKGLPPGESSQVGDIPLPEATEDLETDITSMQRGLEVRATSALLVSRRAPSTKTGSLNFP